MDPSTPAPTDSQPGTVFGKPLNPDALQSILGKRPGDLAAASSDPKRPKQAEDGAAGSDTEKDKEGDDAMNVDQPAAASTPQAKDTMMAVDTMGNQLRPLSSYKGNDSGLSAKAGPASGHGDQSANDREAVLQEICTNIRQATQDQLDEYQKKHVLISKLAFEAIVPKTYAGRVSLPNHLKPPRAQPGRNSPQGKILVANSSAASPKSREEELRSSRGQLSATENQVRELTAKLDDQDRAIQSYQKGFEEISAKLRFQEQAIRDHETNAKFLNDQIIKAQDREAALVQQASSAQGGVDQAYALKLKHDLEETTNTLNEVAVQVAEKDRKILELQRTVDEIGPVADSIAKEKAKAFAEISSKEFQFKKEKAIFENKCREEAKKLSNDLDVVKCNLRAKDQELAQARAQDARNQQEAQGQLSLAVQEIQVKTGQLNELVRDRDIWQKRATDIEAHCHGITLDRDQYKAKAEQAEALAQGVETKDTKLAQAQEEIEALKQQARQESSALQTDLATKTKELQVEKALVVQLRAEKEDLKKTQSLEIGIFEKSLDSKNKELQSLQSALSKAKSDEVAENKKELQDLESLKKQLDSKAEELEVFQKDIPRLETEVEELRTKSQEFDSLKERIESQEQIISAKDQDLAKLRRKAAGLKKTVQELKGELQVAKDESRLDLSPLRASFPGVVSKAVDLSDETSLKVKSTEVSKLKNTIRSQEKELLELYREGRAQQKELAEKDAHIRCLSDANNSWQRFLDKQEADLAKWKASRNEYKERTIIAETYIRDHLVVAC